MTVIAIDGTNGTGKTTLAMNLALALDEKGINAEYARLPGWNQSNACVKIRDILHNEKVDRYTRLHLYLADMNEFFTKRDKKKVYILDRSWLSTLVYQAVDGIQDVEKYIRKDAWKIDYAILLTCDPQVAIGRLQNRPTKTLAAYRDQNVHFYTKIQDEYKAKIGEHFIDNYYIMDTTDETPETLLSTATNFVARNISNTLYYK